MFYDVRDREKKKKKKCVHVYMTSIPWLECNLFRGLQKWSIHLKISWVNLRLFPPTLWAPTCLSAKQGWYLWHISSKVGLRSSKMIYVITCNEPQSASYFARLTNVSSFKLSLVAWLLNVSLYWANFLASWKDRNVYMYIYCIYVIIYILYL